MSPNRTTTVGTVIPQKVIFVHSLVSAMDENIFIVQHEIEKNSVPLKQNSRTDAACRYGI